MKAVYLIDKFVRYVRFISLSVLTKKNKEKVKNMEERIVGLKHVAVSRKRVRCFVLFFHPSS